MEEDLDIGNINIKPTPARSPLINPGIRNGRPLTMSGPSMSGDLGSLYDDITGYNSNSAVGGIERSHTYGENPLSSPLVSPISNGQANIIKRPQVKNIRITKHPVRKESFKSRYSSMIGSPNLNVVNGMNNMNNSRTSRLNNQSTIPMVSSSPLLKGQYSPYSPLNPKPLNGFNLSSPTLPPMTLPGATQSIISTPKSIGSSSYRRSPLLGAEPTNTLSSPILSPKQKPISMIGSPYLGGYNPMPMEDVLDIETMQQQKMIQQEELIKQQQQQILILQQQLLKNQQEMEQSFMDLPKDKNY
jgi:hypothetical protein